MQDIQNIPNPDVNSPDAGDDFGTHSDDNQDIERPGEDVPVPPDGNRNVPIEEPPDEQDAPPIREDQTEPKRIV
jgi:hypothetical protein